MVETQEQTAGDQISVCTGGSAFNTWLITLSVRWTSPSHKELPVYSGEITAEQGLKGDSWEELDRATAVPACHKLAYCARQLCT